MKLAGYEFPDDLYFDSHHGWARLEGNRVTQGLTGLGQALAKEIGYVDLPRSGRRVMQGDPVMSIESGKWVGRIYASVSGKVVEANNALTDAPDLINRAPYTEGWLLKMDVLNLNELQKLWRASDPALAEFVQSEIRKYHKI